MKTKSALLATALLLLSSLGFGQNFVACIGNLDFVLRDSPIGGDPLPDGTPIFFYYDANSNGPDDADQLATVCDLPPDCPTGPGGTVNYNSFPGGMNGEALEIGAGLFYTDPCFTSAGMVPVPSRFYIRVIQMCPYAPAVPRMIWTSTVMTMVVGPQEFYLTASDWVATMTMGCELPPPCTYSGPYAAFTDYCGHPGSRSEDQVVSLCSEFPNESCATVVVGPLCTQDPVVAAGRRPHFTLSYGNCSGPISTTASGWTFDGSTEGPWTLEYVGGEYYFTQQICIGSGTEGCAHLLFDSILPAELGSVATEPLDNAVRIKFVTLSETDLARFEIRRDGRIIARLDANNSPSGHEYMWTDNTAQNGTRYTYDLVSVSTAGAASVLATQSVSPSPDCAVITEYALHQNYPNPFNPTTSIRFDLVEKNLVTLKVYNMTGQEVATVVNGERPAGVNVVSFDAGNLTSGLYFYTLKVGSVYSATRKMLLVK